MTKNTRILLNTLATYGRAVFALLAGVFSSRWLLMGLGAEDLGLQCVVGSMIGAILIFETVMQVSVARFYAFAIGEAKKMSNELGQETIRRWFNVVLLIYLILPFLIVAFGYPVGLYAIRNWLTVPPARMDACVFVFNCAMITTVISMVSTPYVAMYRAKQLIVELTGFDVLRTIIHFFFTFSLLYVPWDRLKYAGLFGAMVAVGISGTLMYRGWRQFGECRIRVCYLFDRERLKKIFGFFFWEFFSCAGNMTRQQGSSIVINKCFGPSANASWQIAQTISNQAMSLSNSLMGALIPAMTTEEGAGERERVIELAHRTCKFGALLVLIFSIPLIAELDEVLHIWLVHPPPFTAPLCSCILLAYVIEKFAIGHHVAISARGKVGLYHGVVGTTFFLSIPIALFLVWRGFGLVSVGYMFIISFTLISLERVFFAKHLVAMPILPYLKRVVVPVCGSSLASYVSAYVITRYFAPSFGRICLTTAVSLSVISAAGWLIILDFEEKAFVLGLFNRLRKTCWRGRFFQS